MDWTGEISEGRWDHFQTILFGKMVSEFPSPRGQAWPLSRVSLLN